MPVTAQANTGIHQAYLRYGMPWNLYNMQPTGGMRYQHLIPGQCPMAGQHLQTVPLSTEVWHVSTQVRYGLASLRATIT